MSGVSQCLEPDGCQASEAASPASAVVGVLDPGDDLAGASASVAEHVLPQQAEEGLHRGVVRACADPAHEAVQAGVSQGSDEGVAAELAGAV